MSGFEVIWFVGVPVFLMMLLRAQGRRLNTIEDNMREYERQNRKLLDDVAALKTGMPRQPESPPERPAAIVPSPTVAPAPASEKPPAVAGSVPPVRQVWASAVPPISKDQPPAATPAAAQPSLEERLGTRWAVWVGGVALALGGLLLARYTIEQGYFGPGFRIIMGLVFAAALIAAGEWFRRSENSPAAGLPMIDIIPSAHIPGVLTAAGTTTAFGTIYAAHALYGFIGTGPTFVLLGLVGIATMLAAALHGPALAGLGLAGSYIAPLLVESARPSPWPIMIYLGVVTASAMGLARIRHWLWLAMLAVWGGVIWGLPFVTHIADHDLDWTLGGFMHGLVQLALAAAFIGVAPHLGKPDDQAQPDRVSATALGLLSLLVIGMMIAGRFDLAAAIPFTATAMAVLLATAWLSAPAVSAAVLAGLVALAGVANWPGLKAPPSATLLAPELAGVLRLPENIASFLFFAALASLAVTAIAGLRLLRGRTLSPNTAALYALAATATPLLALVLTYLRVKQFDSSILFSLASFALAALFVVAADRFQKAETAEFAGSRLATGAFAAAAIAAICFGFVAYLERGYLTVALALTAFGTAFVAVRKDIPLLRHVVTALALVVLGRLAWNPRIMGDGVGRWPIFNWLLIGYGVSAASFWGAARLLETKAASLASRVADAAAILFAGLLCFFQIHHALNGGDALAPTTGHVEQGLFALVALGFSYALMRLDLGRANPVFHGASMAFGVISAAIIVGRLGLADNPWISDEAVRGPAIFSSLMLAYLLPGFAAAVLARAARPHRPEWYVTGIAVLALGLIFSYVTLEVRHIFHGPQLNATRWASGVEHWTYSVSWLALGIAFLAYGILRGSIEARLASAALVLLAVAKVFLFDLSGLTGLWRALSFIVLGLVLMGIGLVYQKIVFAKPRQPG
jgi:uncharacterized membrane protein